jgi:hypothetical protein
MGWKGKTRCDPSLVATKRKPRLAVKEICRIIAALVLVTLPAQGLLEEISVRTPWPVAAKVDGHDVHALGPFDIYSVSPTYFPDLPLQQGNTKPRRKIVPKKSWEIRSSYLGLTPTRLPSSRAAEIEPRSPVFFIDEDASTVGFAGRPEGNPSDVRAFVRILLPSVTTIHSVVLVPPAEGRLPAHFSISIHRWERWDQAQPDEPGFWQKVFEGGAAEALGAARPGDTAPNVYRPEETQSTLAERERHRRECSFAAVDAREVWISSPDDIELADIRVVDGAGRNVASLAAGATVFVSRQSHLFWFDQDTQRYLWPLIYDLGLKWARVNYYLTPLIWPYVERAQGVYRVDPYTENVLREAARNGITITLTLGPAENLLYASMSKEVRAKAFCDYVRFMVRRFKGSIHYFEILNEYYNQDAYGPGKSGPFKRVAEEYAQIAIPAAHVIREEAKDAKIIMAAPCPLGVDWIEAALDAGLAPLVDVISWHPYQLTETPETLDRPRHPWATPEITRYEDAVRYLQKVARQKGFRGTLQANEAGAYAIHRMRSTALVSAKYMARSMVLHSALEVPVFWNETVSLLRPAWQPFFSAGQQEVQPDYSYYVLRTLCTLMDDMQPAPKDVEAEVEGAETAGKIECRLFRNSQGRLLMALWKPVPGSDRLEAVPLNVRVKGFTTSRATGVEIFNGEEQELEFRRAAAGTELEGLMVRDYPLFVLLHPANARQGSAAADGVRQVPRPKL